MHQLLIRNFIPFLLPIPKILSWVFAGEEFEKAIGLVSCPELG
jgi:hypothetical protein